VWLCSAAVFGNIAACVPGGTSGNDDGGNGTVELGVDLAISDEGASHVAAGTQVDYRHDPPASGPHWPTLAAPGFYVAAVDEERWVHNLEHGYVVVLYDCRGDCDSTLLAQLQALAETAPASATWGYAKIVVTPYSGLPEGVLITAVAWDVQLHLATFDEAALLDFYDRYLDQGPEDAG
jgi:hypothetical protein